MHFDKLRRGEIIASISGAVLAVSLFLNWYGTDYANVDSQINGHPRVTLSAWDTQPVVRFVFLTAAVAPLILAYIIVREHQLSWPRGELTAVLAIIAIVLILVTGFVVRPGQPKDTISLQVGWFVALAAGIGMLIGAGQRTAQSGRPRKPPGVI